MTQINKSYYPEINYLRGFAILAVISIHISANFTQMSSISRLTYLYMMIDSISHFAVPAFIFISGFVLYNKYNSEFNLSNFYIKRFKTVIPPYIIFSTFYIIFTLIGVKFFNKTSNLDYIKMYLTGTSFYHMWFFILIIQLYILYPIILKIYNYFKLRNLESLFLIGVAILSAEFLNYNLIYYLFYFVLGIYVNNHYKIPSIHYIYIAGILIIGTIVQISALENSYFSSNLIYRSGFVSNAITIIYYVILCMIFLNVSIWLSNSNKLKLISRLGVDSFSIYLVHAAALYILIFGFSKIGFGWNNILFYPIMMSLTLLFSVLIVKLISNVPGGNIALGNSHNSQPIKRNI